MAHALCMLDKQGYMHTLTRSDTRTHARTRYIGCGYIWLSYVLEIRSGQVVLVGRDIVVTSGCVVRGSNPGRVEIFRTRPDRHCGQPSIL